MILSTGGGGGACKVAWGDGGRAWLPGGVWLPGGHVWLLGGHAWLPGACVVAGGHAWLPGGMHGCWGGGRAWDTKRYGQ